MDPAALALHLAALATAAGDRCAARRWMRAAVRLATIAAAAPDLAVAAGMSLAMRARARSQNRG